MNIDKSSDGSTTEILVYKQMGNRQKYNRLQDAISLTVFYFKQARINKHEATKYRFFLYKRGQKIRVLGVSICFISIGHIYPSLYPSMHQFKFLDSKDHLDNSIIHRII